MMQLNNILNLKNINKLLLMMLVSVIIFVSASNAFAYRNAGGCGGQNRIADATGLSDEEKAKITQIYAAQSNLCETQEKIARKIGKDNDLGAMSGVSNFFGNLDEKEQAALRSANTLQDKERLDTKLTAYDSITDADSVAALKYLRENYPEDYNQLMKDLNEVGKLKKADPDLYKKAAEVSTDALIDNSNPFLSELASQSSGPGGINNPATDSAAKLVRDQAHKGNVNRMRQNGASEEEIQKYVDNAVGAEGIISARQTFGQTKEQARDTVHANQDQTKEVITDGKCDVQGMRKTYQSSCYSCIIVKTLIETFMSACAVAYDVTSEAGIKLLALGALIWIAFFILKNVSSLANVEPGAMVNTLAVFLFKVMVAYIFITSGLGVLVKYTVNPFLTAGADFGNALMATTGNISGAVNPEYKVNVATVKSDDGKGATEIISADVINKIMLFTQNIDATVSTHLVVGHAITCHSMNAGAWDMKIVQVVNLWLWFCGALIWFVGFMLTLGICFYLLDISFKLGFAIMALPIAIGLWPFNVTKGKITAVISIVLKSGATFAFLGLTTTYTLILISSALRDIPTLLAKIEAGETKWISDTFEITGPYFLIILFAYLYSMKLISSTVSDYVDKFFKDSVFSSSNPMHKMTTQAVDFAKQQGMQALKSGGQKVGEAVKEEAKEKFKSAAKFVKGLYKGKAGGKSKSNGGGAAEASGGAVKNSGSAVKASGAAVEQTGKGVEQTGKGVEKGGKAAAQGGKGMMNSGKGMTKAGAQLSGTGLGAIVGVPMMIAGAAVTAGGAAVYAGGKAAEAAGKATQKAGQTMKKSGKSMKKVGEKMEKAGEKIQKVGQKLQFGNGEDKDDKKETKPEEPKQETAPQPEPATEDSNADKK